VPIAPGIGAQVLMTPLVAASGGQRAEGFAMIKLSIQHQGRELLHGIGLLVQCLEIPYCSAKARAGWERDILRAREDLEGLYAAGLRRDFLSSAANRAPRAALDFEPEAGRRGRKEQSMWKTGLEQWQQDLIGRLERGLGRPLVLVDIDCIAWNPEAETLSVVARPLLGELRANNLTSNVFRKWNTRSAS
jgi:hypothetical protein